MGFSGTKDGEGFQKAPIVLGAILLVAGCAGFYYVHANDDGDSDSDSDSDDVEMTRKRKKNRRSRKS